MDEIIPPPKKKRRRRKECNPPYFYLPTWENIVQPYTLQNSSTIGYGCLFSSLEGAIWLRTR